MKKLTSFWARLPFVPLAGFAAFGAYFCTYAFRKPFASVEYAGAGDIFGLDFKIALVIAQVLGYALSKFIGIKVISELAAQRRTALFLSLILLAELALVGFGLVGDHWSALVLLFFNGLPLGMIWGIVFGYLEGRKTTELLGAMLASSFIISSGAVKSVGAWLVKEPWEITTYWMPATTGAIFLLPLVFFALVLGQLPPPSAADKVARSTRAPIRKIQRKHLLLRLGPGLLGIVLFYVLMTGIRDIRDNFAAEIWTALGYAGQPEVFTLAELPIALLTLLPLFACYFVSQNKKALRIYHAIFLVSSLLIALSTLAFSLGRLDGAIWMVLVGLGLYLSYVPLNAIYFDRLIGAFQQVATAGFLIYIADASGYAGSVGIMLYKNFGSGQLDWLPFFTQLASITGLLGCLLAGLSWFAFEKRLRSVSASPPSLYNVNHQNI